MVRARHGQDLVSAPGPDSRCWAALERFWRMPAGALAAPAEQMVSPKMGSSAGRDAWSPEEAAFIDDLFLSEHARAHWPFLDGQHQQGDGWWLCAGDQPIKRVKKTNQKKKTKVGTDAPASQAEL